MTDSASGRSPKPEARSPDWWDRAGIWLAEHGALPALGLITLAVALAHIRVFFGEVKGDDLTFHFAESARIADCLRHFDFDLWNPSANAGYASAYYYQVLPQLASALPTAIFGHHLFWFQLSVWLPLAAAPAAAYRGMRLIGATPWQAAIAAFAIAFTNGESKWGGGNAGTFQVGLYTQTWALAAFPLALGYGAQWIAHKKKLAPAIAWGAFVGLCHPFAVIVLGLGLFVSVVARLVPALDKLAWPSIAGRAISIVGIAVLWGIPRGWIDFIPPLAVKIFGTLLVATGLSLPVFVRDGTKWVMPEWGRFREETLRTLVLGGCMVLAWMPVWLPLLADYSGFGGFPHRVGGEEGPGFYELAHWYRMGMLLDWSTAGLRFAALTWSLPIILLFVRNPLMRWLWPPALFFAALLGLGPSLGKIGDDLFPAVRALGAMQIVLALGIGAGAVMLGRTLWNAPWEKWFRIKASKKPGEEDSVQYTMRTVVAAGAAALAVLVALPGWRALEDRVRVLAENEGLHRDELLTIGQILAKQPPARKQPAAGANSHWWNLLPYVYDRVPTTLQMGGGGLQASPNYDFLWTSQEREDLKVAWVFDAPYVVFESKSADKVPAGETIARTEHYEIRRLPAPGLVSPIQVIGVLPPGYRNREAGHLMALEWYTGRPTFETKRWLEAQTVTLAGDEPMKDKMLAYAGSGPATAPPDGHTIRAWHEDSPGDYADIVADVEVNKPTTFVVRESWHPRWRAYVDGEPARMRRVTPDFPAVDVPVGQHRIDLRFERPLWAVWCWLAWPGVPLCAWLVLRWLARRVRPAPTA